MNEWLDEEIERAECRAAESSRCAVNSYGAGYDTGYLDALKAVRNQAADDQSYADLRASGGIVGAP